jgi:signal transduction histidine kinase
MLFINLSITTFLCVLSFSLYSQDHKYSELLDKWTKLEKEKNSKADTAKVFLLNELAASIFQSEPEKSVLFAKKAFYMARKLKYMRGEVDALINLSKSYYIKGSYDLSLKAATQAYDLSLKSGYTPGKASALNGVGLIYLAQHDYKMALGKFHASAIINESLKDYKKLAINQANIGICYIELDQSEKAFEPLNSAIELSKRFEMNAVVALATNHLGVIYLRKRDYRKAIALHQAVIENKNYQDDWENSFAYSGLAKAYFSSGDYNKAIINGKKGLMLARKINAKWEISRCLTIIQESYAAIHNYKEAYTYLKAEKISSDSLSSKSKESEINSLHLKHEKVVNQSLLKLNKLTQQKMRNSFIMLTIIGLIATAMLVLMVLLYQNYRQKIGLNALLQKKSDDIEKQNALIVIQNEALIEINQTKDQLFSVIGHDLRNPIASILQTLEMLKDNRFSKEEMSFLMSNFHDKVTQTAAMLDNLLLWASSQLKGISPRFEVINLFDLTDQLLYVYRLMAVEKTIHIAHPYAEHALIFADPNHVKIILQNIINNAIKFTPVNGKIVITYKITANHVSICIQDNGIGISDEKIDKLFNLAGEKISTYGTNNEKGIGIGLLLVKRFADENNAAITVTSEKERGTTFTIKFLLHSQLKQLA